MSKRYNFCTGPEPDQGGHPGGNVWGGDGDDKGDGGYGTSL